MKEMERPLVKIPAVIGWGINERVDVLKIGLFSWRQLGSRTSIHMELKACSSDWEKKKQLFQNRRLY